MENSKQRRTGIISSGNWVVDFVKIIDRYPKPTMLSNIIHQDFGLGGAPHNVLVNLSVLDPVLPLYAAGVIGEDANGDKIIQALDRHHINHDHLYRTPDRATSYTDVMTEKKTGQRTFFHCRGSNTLLGPEHFDPIDIPARIFHLGYLLLLDRLDAIDAKSGVVAAGVLKCLSEKGYKISLDVITEKSFRYEKVIVPCLPYIDYLIVNDTEAACISGVPVHFTTGKVADHMIPQAAKWLIENGVKDTVVIHYPVGAYATNTRNEEVFQKSFKIPHQQIKGTVGAGDAFCAGMLYSLHEGWSLESGVNLAHAMGAISLTHPTSTGAAKSLEEVMKVVRKG